MIILKIGARSGCHPFFPVFGGQSKVLRVYSLSRQVGGWLVACNLGGLAAAVLALAFDEIDSALLSLSVFVFAVVTVRHLLTPTIEVVVGETIEMALSPLIYDIEHISHFAFICLALSVMAIVSSGGMQAVCAVFSLVAALISLAPIFSMTVARLKNLV